MSESAQSNTQHACPFCDKHTFNTATDYYEDVRRHVAYCKANPHRVKYTCTVCTKTLNTPGNVKNHRDGGKHKARLAELADNDDERAVLCRSSVTRERSQRHALKSARQRCEALLRADFQRKSNRECYQCLLCKIKMKKMSIYKHERSAKHKKRLKDSGPLTRRGCVVKMT